jgi:heme b synthase
MNERSHERIPVQASGHPSGHPAAHPGKHPANHPGGKSEGHPGGHPGNIGHGGQGPRGAHGPTATLEDGSPVCRLIAWEVTRSCNLACKHCRAEAHLEPYPGELSTDEAKALIDTFPDVGNPIIIFTGGEPLMRHDIFELVAHAKSKGLRCVMAPNGTLVTAEIARKMVEAGIERCSLSVDGPDAATHDEFRGVEGSFQGVLNAIEHFKSVGLEFQINTTVTRGNLGSFKDIFQLAERVGAAAWHIFLLVPTGRAAQLGAEVISAEEYENVLNWFYDFRKTTTMQLKATCAPHYHRILRQRAKEDGTPVTFENFGLDAVSRGCLGGVGFCFISHTGQVQPCGYLELDCGQVKEAPFPQIWRASRQFLNLRDPKTYTGKCGSCEYERVCGGCRARAATMRGDYLAEEPLCSHTPRKGGGK